jgi:hypothetical protein
MTPNEGCADVARCIFEANPHQYALGVLRRGYPIDAWSIGRHRDELADGDGAALWLSGSDCGVIATGPATEATVDPNKPGWGRQRRRA